MTFFSEHFQSNEGSTDINGIGKYTRVFDTLHTSRKSVMGNPACPSLGSPHPEEPRAFLDRYEFRCVEDGIFRLSCLYTTDGSGTWTVFDQFKVRWGYSRQRVRIKIPTYSLHGRPLNNVDGTIIFAWEPADGDYSDINDSFSVLHARVQVPKVRPADLRAISREQRYLHLIDGEHQMFIDADIDNVDNRFDIVTYSWLIDDGTLDPRSASFDAPNLAYPPKLPNTGDPGLIRLPYHFLIGVPKPPQNGFAQKPQIINFPVGVDSSSHYMGWRNFPGMAGA